MVFVCFVTALIHMIAAINVIDVGIDYQKS